MSGWISVEDRLPEDEQLVLTAGLEFGLDVLEFCLYEDGTVAWSDNHAMGELLDGVTHWQPLPPPPG